MPEEPLKEEELLLVPGRQGAQHRLLSLLLVPGRQGAHHRHLLMLLSQEGPL